MDDDLQRKPRNGQLCYIYLLGGRQGLREMPLRGSKMLLVGSFQEGSTGVNYSVEPTKTMRMEDGV